MSNNTQGVFWALLAAALFSVVIALAKLTATEYHVLQILFFRQIVVFVSSLPDIAKTFPDSLKTRRPGIHALRLIGTFVALSTGIWAVAVLPLTTATTLAFVQVFFVTLLAFWFLKEPVGLQRLGAIVAGFVGVIVVMRPGIDGFINIYALLPIFGAFGAAVAVISVRNLSQTESTATLLVYQSFFAGILAGIPLFWFWTNPDPKGLSLLLVMGVLATIGQWVGIKALRLGEASVVGNMGYSKLLYAAIFGYAVFGEIPNVYTLIGAGNIIGSSVYILRHEVIVKKNSL